VPRRQRFPPRQTQLDGTLDVQARPAAEGVGASPAPASLGATGAGTGGGAAFASHSGTPSSPGSSPGSGVPGAKRTLLRPPPWDKGADTDPGASFGSWLRRQREAREISLREIAERTKISLRYLQAMEEDRFESLPAPVFAKGFLREYARYVGLSPDDVVNHYLSVQQAAAEDGEEQGRPARDRRVRPSTATLSGSYGSPSSSSWPRVIWLSVIIALLLGLAAVLAFVSDRWRQGRVRRGEDRPPIVAPVAAPVPPAGPEVAAPPSAPLEVTVDFSQECWVEALVDGGNRRAEMREAGESMQLDARQSVVFTKLGNAAAVEIQVNGYPYPLEKKPGDVVRGLKIDLDTVRELSAKAKKEGH
jgi:cytoskeleton protein RodZ